MYKKVLVPLDGSRVAEATLTHVKELFKFGAVKEIVLLTVVEDISWHETDVSSAWGEGIVEMKKLKQDRLKNAEAYMLNVQSGLQAEGIQTKVEVLTGFASQTIVRYAKDNQCDLIVIAAHSTSMIKEWVFGSVALRVLHDAQTPVLMIKPEKG